MVEGRGLHLAKKIRKTDLPYGGMWCHIGVDSSLPGSSFGVRFQNYQKYLAVSIQAFKEAMHGQSVRLWVDSI
jgi:hypothetical protein